ncbi:hypothetical protein ACQKWADRAFT_317433 [Trichoderma austrokoningii]
MAIIADSPATGADVAQWSTSMAASWPSSGAANRDYQIKREKLLLFNGYQDAGHVQSNCG